MTDFSMKDPMQPRGLGLLSRRGFLSMSAALSAATIVDAGNVLAANASPKGQIVIGFSQEPTVFNPLMPAYRSRSGRALEPVQPALGRRCEGQFHAATCAEVPTVENGGISADGLNWRVKLRPGVKWHDGAPFTADDVKFTLDLINNKDFRANRRTGHELVRDIKVVSPTEITWRMEKVYAPYLVDPVLDLHRAEAHPGARRATSTPRRSTTIPSAPARSSWSERDARATTSR